MPATKEGHTVLSALQSEYGSEKGENIAYAMANMPEHNKGKQHMKEWMHGKGKKKRKGK